MALVSLYIDFFTRYLVRNVEIEFDPNSSSVNAIGFIIVLGYDEI